MEFNEIKITGIDREGKIEFNSKFFELTVGTADENMIKKFYNQIYDYILEKEKMIEFVLEEEIVDNLFKEILSVFIVGLNKEIKESEENIKKIIDHKKELK